MSKAPPRALTVATPRDREIAEKVSSLSGKGMSKAETAQYIAEFAAELSYLAREARLDLLAYLLDMAKLEAGRVDQAEKRKR